MSKKQAKINEDIAQLITNKDAKDETYNYEEIAFLQEYAGAGGLANAGVQSRGLLYEYYTPYPIVEKMWALARKFGFTSGRVLEPSCGIGRFLRYVDPKENDVVAYEFAKDNTISGRIAQITYPEFDIRLDYFESIFYDGNKRTGHPANFDVVIGNPPYGKFTGYYKGRESKHTNATTYDQYFIWAGIQLLKKGGVLVMIIPSAFLDNESKYNDFKADLKKQAELVDAYRLPRGAFNTTDIQTDIIVLKKK